jgi:hypothetical protein
VEFERGYLDVIPYRWQMGILEGCVLDAKSRDDDSDKEKKRLGLMNDD